MLAVVLWNVISGVLAVVAIALLVFGQSGTATALLLVAVVMSMIGSYQATKKREREFRARFHSVERILETHDLDEVKELRAERGEVVAVRAVRRHFPGISLTDAVALVRAL
ncbi:hypothetical protein JOF53_002600 [Crossiella equi]|uniref:Uncharacterized protein n=1 Tax=Crossiella equi TaxID=130796 RepID=A0ABS5AAW9_9PSEU|nr:hypothetical protein [Crossiella equi]MBP2473728.1 hypothetical protein [Crossiella equi]